MGMKCSLEVSHVFVLVLLLCLLPCFSQSAPSSAAATAKPSSFKVKVRGINNKEQETNALPKLEGRRLGSSGIIARPSTSGQGPKKNDNYHGRRLLSSGSGVVARPSTSGQGPKKNDNYHGRRLFSIYSPNAIIRTPPSTSGQGPKKNDNYNGRRLSSIYFPNAEIGAGASKSGKGGGRTPEDSP
ncbi:hypothetical protein AALP_AA6G138500 [Arabis alpina]|uniref:Uncharacterized protein n=1 Tax=Arabis alpina TaxID=50452 RepID=A0A087GP33_ARAAL|nr:hypothetical protein AALP_AA6G138500 [Arabis alpina]